MTLKSKPSILPSSTESLLSGVQQRQARQTVATLIWMLREHNTSARILVCTSTNVAVDTDCDRVMRTYRSHRFSDEYGHLRLPIVRLYFMSQVTAGYLKGENRHPFNGHDPLNPHIHSHRLRLAHTNPAAWTGFINGHRHLSRYRVFSGDSDAKKIAKEYFRACRAMTDIIMEYVSVVFCTTAAISDSALEARDEKSRLLVGWRLSDCVINEAAYLTAPEIMAVAAKKSGSIIRFILAGDYRQLQQEKQSLLAKKVWHTTIFEELKKKGFLCTILDTEYRGHSELSKYYIDVFYQGRVQSAFQSRTILVPIL